MHNNVSLVYSRNFSDVLMNQSDKILIGARCLSQNNYGLSVGLRSAAASSFIQCDPCLIHSNLPRNI